MLNLVINSLFLRQFVYQNISFMRTLVQILFLFFVITSCTKKEPKTVEINGQISPASATYLILQKETDIERKIIEVIDTIKVDRQGAFRAFYNIEPYVYSLKFPNKKSVTLAIGKKQDIRVEVKNYNSENATITITGSQDAEELAAYENFRAESLDRLVESVRRSIKELKKDENPDLQKIAELGQLELSNYDAHLDELNAFIKNKMSETVGLYATSLRWKGAKNLALFDSLASNFEMKYPDLEISKKIREKVTRLQQTSIGGRTADILLPSIDGTELKLSSIRSKFILIDFWASWCGPCRRESGSLNDIYATYDRANFDIYGVSLDDQKQKWIDAIEKDNRIWSNVSSLERFKTPAAYDYAVTALPDNFLIDQNRTIIAKNVHGEELAKLLETLLK